MGEAILGLRKLAVRRGEMRAGALAAYGGVRTSKQYFLCGRTCFRELLRRFVWANVTLVDGLISDCGRMVAERKEGRLVDIRREGAFRIEGKRRWDMNS